MVLYGTLWYSIVRYLFYGTYSMGTLRYSMVLYGTLWYSIVRYLFYGTYSMGTLWQTVSSARYCSAAVTLPEVPWSTLEYHGGYLGVPWGYSWGTLDGFICMDSAAVTVPVFFFISVKILKIRTKRTARVPTGTRVRALLGEYCSLSSAYATHTYHRRDERAYRPWRRVRPSQMRLAPYRSR
jgi:hypothetical protein